MARISTDIPLGRLSSSYLSTYKSSSLDLSPTWTSASTLRPILPTDDAAPSQILQVQAVGKSPISFPRPPTELEIPIFDDSGYPKYLSIRPQTRSGTCHLVLGEDESATSIARTTYRFGPVHCPVIKIGKDDDLCADVFEIRSESIMSRTMLFTTRRWGTYRWRYVGKKERNMGVDNLLILEREGGPKDWNMIARLKRGESTRTPGTKKRDAGNGGRLEMFLGGILESEELEIIIVVTCLVMLKKEIDRLRGAQIAVLTGALSGGGS
ncbi:hypothetical protein B0O99DRAFT_641099 [Bisporella sp. PMI_857]|nr:hypothetical protein B0O99DRAFT_641099 [Bisporella sp. PMI_857]